MKKTKLALFHSVIALILCFSMLIGTTFAWFTDVVQSGVNQIVAGNLDVELEYLVNGQWKPVTESTNVFAEDALWEPGYTEVVYLRISNKGSLALKYQLGVNIVSETPSINVDNEPFKLSQYIQYGMKADVDGKTNPWSDRAAAVGAVSGVSQALSTGYTGKGVLYAEGKGQSEQYLAMVVYMPETVGNKANYMTGATPPEIMLGINLVATQQTNEEDSFGSDYDDGLNFPELKPGNISVDVKTDAGKVTEQATMAGEGIGATVPVGVQVNDGVGKLTLSVAVKPNSEANLTLGENELLQPLDVHVDGVSKDNTQPIIITIEKAMMTGLNMGNYKLYHVENGVANEMKLVSEPANHNEFSYDPATGDVTLAMATFSEVAVVAEQDAAWKGEFDYSWYNTTDTSFVIANADQLAAFGAIVGGMAKDENGNFLITYKGSDEDEHHNDSFSGKTVKLISDINLGDDEEHNVEGKIFYPIGYWNDEGTYEKYQDKAITSGFYTFEGTFDGNGHTIANFYQNTWEMKGDHNWYDAKDQHYRDGMGLFGKVYGGTVKNLTVSNFSSDGEIATTGVIAAYADGATFENIAITNCNPRVYNIGNGGIVGCVGWYAKEADLKTTFTNITVDNSNKISALWGSYDVACGGIVGQYYPTSGQSSANYPVNAGIHFENCHVSAVMDVYNDVCANYQYYAYRYTGMLIGSIRENETIDGHVYPKMDGITASGCTVHFGDWNDYYYCELVANSLASYTHDHQFSRLEQVAKVEGTTITPLKGEAFTVPSSGRYNYVVVNGEHATENATCYHFVDGKVHNHDDYNGDGVEDYETVNGESIPVENNRHIYLEFNNLFTGYGWGVTSKGLTDFNGVTNMDITQGDYEKSETKFDVKDELPDFYDGTTVKIGELFEEAKDINVPIKDDNVQITVSPVGNDSTVSCVYVANTDEWEKGTLVLKGSGSAVITITDYYFCNPTTISVNINCVDKFGSKFDKDFLYRVGNKSDSTVALGTMFEKLDGVDVDSSAVEVKIAGVAGDANGTFTANTSDWTKGTIQFSGTGVVKVTIAGSSANAVDLYLEVINATNITSATGTTSGGNLVLLCDVNTTSYVNYWNCTLYGNGFTYSLNGAPTAYNSKQGHGVLITKNATLDNLVIVGDVYNSYGAYTNQDYYNAAVDVVGDTIIQNCYISGCAAPVSTRANATISNTTLYGGTVANLIIKSGTVTLEDVTTANYDDGRSLIGMGIVIHSDATEAAKLVLNGTLTQYNFISEANAPSDSNAKILYNAMFDSSCSKYHFGTSPNRYVNAGIISMTANFDKNNIVDNANTGYTGTAVTVNSVNGYVYTQPNTSGSVNNNCPEYRPTTQGAVPPSYSFDYTNKNYVGKNDGSNDYCYEENGKVNISMDQGDTFNWDTSILTIGKGITNYTVSMNGTDYTGKSIAFNTAGDYEVTYTYTDDNNYKLDANGDITTYSVTYTKTVNITVAVVEAATKHAEFTFGSSNTASTTVTVGNNTYVMPNVSATSSTIGSTTVDGKTIYYPIVEIVMSDGKTSHTSGWYAYFPVFSGAVTITDYKDNGLGEAETFGSSTQSMPSGLSVVGDPAQLFKYQSSSTAGTSPVVKNKILVYSSPSISAKRSEYNTVIQYSYQDNAGATYYYYIGYHAPAQSYTSCVTADTLVTLADGTQKRIDEVTFEDQLLVWDFDKGEYTVTGSSIIENHGYDMNNVIKLTFEDGAAIKVVNVHGFFDADLNKWVDITAENAQDFVGHRFTQVDGDSYKTVKLVSATVTTEYVEAWAILTADHYNCILESMFSITPPATEQLAFFEIGEDMKYDAEAKQADIAKYGLYTYEEFAHLLTEEQFDALNVAEIKIAIGKGLITYDEVLWLIATYVN